MTGFPPRRTFGVLRKDGILAEPGALHFSVKNLNYDFCDYMIDYDDEFGALHLSLVAEKSPNWDLQDFSVCDFLN